MGKVSAKKVNKFNIEDQTIKKSMKKGTNKKNGMTTSEPLQRDEIQNDRQMNNVNKKLTFEQDKFQKFYFQRLSSEHPNWSIHQINHIIKLLKEVSDKKKIVGNKNINGKKDQRIRKIRYMTGKQLFCSKYDKQKWNMLPGQSRRYWNNVALGQDPFNQRKQINELITFNQKIQNCLL